METKIVYFDETGDDGNNTKSSNCFILTGVYMFAEDWQQNFDIMRNLKVELKNKYGFPIKIEMHTKHFLTDKLPYRNYGWTRQQKREILHSYLAAIGKMKIEVVNVVIDKTKINSENYPVLENALKYNLQRIDTTSNHSGNWNYLVFSDEGRIEKMKKTARLIRVYNPVQNDFNFDSRNLPIKYMIEDIVEKNSAESYFIQTSDFISYFIHLYMMLTTYGGQLPNRVAQILSSDEVANTIEYFKKTGILNLHASRDNDYGLVIYPKK